MTRRTVFYSGRVQGVGFRYTTHAIALKFSVSGFVRNLADGRVELVVEGAEDEVERLVTAIGAELRSNIRDAAISDSLATGEFTSFSITR